MTNNIVTINSLKDALHYDELTGIFTWRIYRNQIAYPGKIAGCKNQKGYIELTLFGRRFKCHRLAWFYVHEVWPNGEIDHINCIRDDNRIINLRVATRSENNVNTKLLVTNTSGLKGIYLDKRRVERKWLAKISINNKTKFIGYYSTAQEAHEAYVRKAKEVHGEFFRAR